MIIAPVHQFTCPCVPQGVGRVTARSVGFLQVEADRAAAIRAGTAK